MPDKTMTIEEAKEFSLLFYKHLISLNLNIKSVDAVIRRDGQWGIDVIAGDSHSARVGPRLHKGLRIDYLWTPDFPKAEETAPVMIDDRFVIPFGVDDEVKSYTATVTVTKRYIRHLNLIGKVGLSDSDVSNYVGHLMLDTINDEDATHVEIDIKADEQEKS